MTIWTVASLRGAPGATSLAMGLGATWPVTAGRTTVVVEADPIGGVLAARFDELRADRTIADAAVAMRREFDAARLLDASRSVWGGLRVIPAHPSAEQTASVLDHAAERLAIGLAAASEIDAIVDVGCLTAKSPALPLARRSVATLLVARTRFEDVAALTARARDLRGRGIEPWLVAVGTSPYSPEEVAEAAEVPLAAVLPHDPRSAAVLAGERAGDGRLRRSLLWRTMCELSSRLLELAAPPTVDLSSSEPDSEPREELGGESASWLAADVAAP
jgi:hypothetical protein